MNFFARSSRKRTEGNQFRSFSPVQWAFKRWASMVPCSEAPRKIILDNCPRMIGISSSSSFRGRRLLEPLDVKRGAAANRTSRCRDRTSPASVGGAPGGAALLRHWRAGAPRKRSRRAASWPVGGPRWAPGASRRSIPNRYKHLKLQCIYGANAAHPNPYPNSARGPLALSAARPHRGIIDGKLCRVVSTHLFGCRG